MTDPIVTTTYKKVKVKYTHFGTWRYSVSYAVSFGYRAVPTHDTNCKIVRLWLGSTLVYDCYRNIGNSNFIFYPGTEDQPFYRGQMVLFLGDTAVSKSASAPPAVTAEIVDGADLISIVGDVFVARHLTPNWAEYSPDVAKILQAIPDASGHLFRTMTPRTNSELGSKLVAGTFDLSVPVFFAPWQGYALAQNDAQKVLLDIVDGQVISTFGATSTPASPDFQNFMPALFGIAQNAGNSYSAGTTFFVLASAQDGDGNWPYQIASVSNGKLVYGGKGVWADEPACMARGERAGNNISFENTLVFGTPPTSSTGDVLVAFDYSVRRIRVGVAGSGPLTSIETTGAVPPALTPNLAPTVDDDEIYSHLSGVGKIVRVYHYNLYGDLREAYNPIILLIETNATTHQGVARKIGYDGTVLWTTGTIDLDDVTDPEYRTMQSTGDLTANRLGIISYHTPGTYTLIDLSTGAVETGTYAGLSFAAGEPAFWLSIKNSFYPLLTDNKYLITDIPDSTGLPLDDAIRSLAIRAGYLDADITITGLHDILIQGYIVGASTNLGDILNNLATLYQFTYAEIGAKLFVMAVFNGETFISQLDIPEDDLAVLTEGNNGDQQIVNVVINDDSAMPARLSVRYIDPDVSYQQNVQTVKRIGTPETNGSTKGSTFTVPIIAHGTEMLARLYRALYSAWAAQDALPIRLPPKYLAIMPTDGFTFTALGFEHRVTVVSATYNADFSISLTTVERNGSNRLPTVTTQDPVQPAASGPQAPIRAILLDLPDTSPAADATDTLNLGVALTGYVADQWSSGRLELATAGVPSSWGTRLNSTEETPVGSVLAITGPSVDPLVLDTTTTITFELGTIDIADLANATDDEMLAGANLTAVGRDGRYELLTWGNIVDNGDGTATVDTLYRGRFGTDAIVGMIEAGDFFVPYAGVKTITYPVDDYLNGVAYSYRGTVPGEDPEEATQSFIIPNANSHREYAPITLYAYRVTDELNRVDVYWSRREKFTAAVIDDTALVPTDSGRVFSIDLYAADMTSLSMRVATFTMADDDPFNHYSFTTEQMAAAGYDDLSSALNAIVYQVDDVIGRGWGSYQLPIPITDISFDGAIELAGAMASFDGAIAMDNLSFPMALAGAMGPFGATAVLHIAEALTLSGAMGHFGGSAAIVLAEVLTLSGAMGHLSASTSIAIAERMTMTIAMGGFGSSIVGTDGSSDELTYNGDSLTYNGDTLEYN